VNQHVKYLPQRSLCLKVIVQIHTRTQLTNSSVWTTKWLVITDKLCSISIISRKHNV